MSARPVRELGTLLGEGPRWDPAAELLHFVDAAAGVLFAYDPPRDTLDARALAEPVLAVALAANATSHIGICRTGFVRVSDDVAPLGPRLVDGVDEWLNDGRCDRLGRFWAGTATKGARSGQGALYRLDGRDKPPVRVHDGVVHGNGIGWSPDDSRMYFVDSKRRRLDAFEFDLEPGALRAPVPVVELANDDGLPDGIAVDVEGCVWVATWGRGEVRRYTPRGRLDSVVTVGATNVTSCALTPHGLYVTTAREGDEQSPLAGALFHVDVGIAGLPEPRFFD